MKRSIQLENENTDSKSTPTNFNNGNVSWTNTSQTSSPPEQEQNVAPATMVPVERRGASFGDCIEDLHVLTDLIQFADPVNNPQLAFVNHSFLNAWTKALTRQMLKQHSPLNEEIQHFIDNEENICKYYEQYFSCKGYIELLKSLKNDYSPKALRLKEANLNALNYTMSLTLRMHPAKYTHTNDKLTFMWSGCYLTRLPIDESFMDLPCESWDLSNNNLSSIPQVIWDSKDLEHLNITGNLFKDLPTNSRDILYARIINTDGTSKTTKLTKEQCLRAQKNATVNENTSNNDQTILSPRNRQPKQ